MRLLLKYIRFHLDIITVIIACIGIFTTVFYLSNLPLNAVLYAALLSGTALLAVFIYRFVRYYQRCCFVGDLRSEVSVTLQNIPPECEPLEEEYQTLLFDLFERSHEIEEKNDTRYREMLEYYTSWVHQIKTPIAAMKLQLQAEDTSQNRTLLEDLQKIEQYVEMVLCYLRLDSESTDYLFAEYDIDEILRQAVRRFSSQFITRKIRLIYEPLNCKVLTDEKWILFVIEQVLSNALKYTPSDGTVEITLEEPETLCIRDNGIGIAPEDLPRIFEKGYTGCNGRADKKASGIGLYLCKRICNNLNHVIKADSIPDCGTVIKINFHREKRQMK